MNKAVSSEQKPLDVICLGRVAVDLYGQQIGLCCKNREA